MPRQHPPKSEVFCGMMYFNIVLHILVFLGAGSRRRELNVGGGGGSSSGTVAGPRLAQRLSSHNQVGRSRTPSPGTGVEYVRADGGRETTRLPFPCPPGFRADIEREELLRQDLSARARSPSPVQPRMQAGEGGRDERSRTGSGFSLRNGHGMSAEGGEGSGGSRPLVRNRFSPSQSPVYVHAEWGGGGGGEGGVGGEAPGISASCFTFIFFALLGVFYFGIFFNRRAFLAFNKARPR